jgi:hypothetical protein
MDAAGLVAEGSSDRNTKELAEELSAGLRRLSATVTATLGTTGDVSP